MSERFDQGKYWFEKIYGEGKADGLLEMQTGAGQDLARMGIEWAFGDIYSRPGLSLSQRELLSLASLVTIGGLEPQLRGHTRGAVHVGCTATEIIETVIHMAQYVGLPKALNALTVVTKQLGELGVEIPRSERPQQ